MDTPPLTPPTLRRTEGVTVIDLPGFLELLRFGLVMDGVTDGCEPTAEEVQQGVSR